MSGIAPRKKLSNLGVRAGQLTASRNPSVGYGNGAGLPTFPTARPPKLELDACGFTQQARVMFSWSDPQLNRNGVVSATWIACWSISPSLEVNSTAPSSSAAGRAPAMLMFIKGGVPAGVDRLAGR